ncbi:hypothetical protein M3Y94_00633600 [Aphelenchoides besseyi]|nr:hypothetical protein M3Y94_00633600 [Aphelenchoides besseyi]
MSIMKFSGLALLIGVFCLTVEVATPKKLNAEIDALLNELKELAHKLSYDINDDKTKTYLETHTDDYGIIQTDAGKPISAIAVFQVSKIFLKNGFDVYDDGQINPANYDEALHEYDKTILGKNYTSWIDGRNKRNIFC